VRTIIAGGRDYRMTEADFLWLDSLKPPITEVITGGARGADTGAFNWGWSRGIPVTTLVPDWKNLGRSAGPRRNLKMALIAERCVLFPGGRGTASMEEEARKMKLTIIHRFSQPLPPQSTTQ
jgi:predicted Rossmann-fold nucleotide-binding protein